MGDNHTVIGIPGEDGEDMCIQIDGDSVEVTDCEICMGEQEEEAGGKNKLVRQEFHPGGSQAQKTAVTRKFGLPGGPSQ